MKCKNDAFMRMVSVEKLNKELEVDFDVQRNLPDCNRISAKKYISTEAESPRFDKYTIPTNQFECLNHNCVNSGVLYNDGAKTVYRTTGAGSEFSAGVITFYVTEAVTSAVVTLSNDVNATNAWQYTVTPGRSVGGFKPVVVDLTQTPTIVGNGFTPADTAAYIGITLTGGATVGETTACSPLSCIGLSSIAIFDDMEDFNASAHVKVGCLTGIDGTWDLDAAESTCFNNGYDTSSRPTFEKTITGNKVTPNYWRMNPLYKRGEETQGFDIITEERVIRAENGYGVVVIADMNQNECGFFSAEIVESACASTEMNKLSIPTLVALDGGHYILVDNGDGSTSVIFNEMYVGQKALITYPRTVEVEEFVLSADGLNEVRTRMSYVKKMTDGVKYRFVFDNVLVTSFPDAITEDETEFAFTISIQPDVNGRYGRAYKIVE